MPNSPCRAAIEKSRQEGSTPTAKESAQHFYRLALAKSPIDLRRMVTGRMRVDARPVLDPAALRIRCGVIEPPDARERDGGRAHRAGFQRHVKIGIADPLRSGFGAGRANGENLGMRRGVIQFAGAVSRRRDHTPAGEDRGADRNLAAFRRAPGLRESDVETAFRHGSIMEIVHVRASPLPMLPVKALSGRVDTGWPRKMRQNEETGQMPIQPDRLLP